MSEWLFNILKNGTLVDNQIYSVDNGRLTNRRIADINLCYNNEPDNIWRFVKSVARDVEKMLSNNSADALVLFNDKEYEHNVDEGFINVTGTDARNFTLYTGNLIGFVKHKDYSYSLKVSSRFGDDFLKYIIADADGFLELENIGGNESSDDGYEWLLAYLWNVKFKRAFRLGLPKTYVSKNERIARVRGNIDAIDYFQNRSSGTFKCSYREHSYENPATTLFIKAYEAIKRYPFCQRTRGIYNAFLTANQGTKRSRREVLCTPHFTNPFYNDYNSLIDLSKQILNQKSSYFGTASESSAFFFDISMLFEYFIRKLLKRDGVHLLSKLEHKRTIPTGGRHNYGRRKLEPDLVFESKGELYVFDVKYKIFDKNYGVKREDLFQLHTYIGQYGNRASIKGCGFIYPISEEHLDGTDGIAREDVCQQGKKIPFFIVFLKVPSNTGDHFASAMSESCSCFVRTFQKHVIEACQSP